MANTAADATAICNILEQAGVDEAVYQILKSRREPDPRRLEMERPDRRGELDRSA